MKIILWLVLLFSLSTAVYSQSGLIFNGTDFPTQLTSWSWGQSTIEVESGAGPVSGTNAIKWVQGDEWANGWTGIGFTVSPAFNLNKEWAVGKVVFKMKCEEGVGALRVQYEDGTGKVGVVFTPTADNQWHEYSFATGDFVFQDGTTSFDPANINTIGIMAEATAVAGKVIYMTDWYLETDPSLIVFNGIAIPSTMEIWTWGNAGAEVMQGTGPIAGTNAIQWTQVEGGNGFGFTVNPMYDLSEVWQRDSMKFKMKAEEGIDTITIMLYDGARMMIGNSFVPTGDNQWHDYSFSLKNMEYLGGSVSFDSSTIQFVELNTGVFAGTGTAGKKIFITDWWTGNPVFDVIPPSSPAGLSAVPSDSNKNIITWTDIEGEEKERYNIYFSENPITDIAIADVAALKIEEGIQQFEHKLTAPVSDRPVSYYYAITSTDASGNTSQPALLGNAVTNTGKGVVTISWVAPSQFAADGDLTEWAGITPIHMAPSSGGYVVTGTTITDDTDLSLDAYLAIDNTYLYVAFDVEDDIVSITGSDWANDAPDLYIGLYNWHGPQHSSFRRGAEPDYHLRFLNNRLQIDGVADSILVPGNDYFWAERFPTGYSIEARIPLTVLAERAGDEVFSPLEGMRIPIDFDIIDSDAPDAREGILCFSENNNANSWSSPIYWTHTWIGEKSTVGVKDIDVTDLKYSLTQNYPNPFNPSTQIKYTIEKQGMVTLKIFDMLGREVRELIHQTQNAGVYTVNFDASGLSSGIYVYQINTGTFQSSKKMLFMK